MPHYSATKLPDSDGDGLIKLSSGRAPYRSGQTVKHCPDAPVIDAAKPHCYVLASEACPIVVTDEPPLVTPPPPPPPVAAAIKAAIVAGEVFMQGRFLSVGLNGSGTIGTTKPAPAGFDTDAETGLLRAGLVFDPDSFGSGRAHLNDAIQQGRAIEGFNIGYKVGGKTFVQSNMLLTGFNEIKGANRVSAENDAIWLGTTPESLEVEQRVVLSESAKHLRIDVTLTNRSASTLTDLRYMRTADPDQDGVFATSNRIAARGRVEAALAGGFGTFFLHTDDLRAFADFGGFVNSDPYLLTPKPEGAAKKADESVSLVFLLGDVPPGRSRTLTMSLGVTDDLPATLREIGA